MRDFAPSYFEDLFIHIRDFGKKDGRGSHRAHTRHILTLMLAHKLYAKPKKFIFAAIEEHLLRCIVGKHGVLPDPEKIKAITDWHVLVDVKGLKKLNVSVLWRVSSKA